MSDLTLNLSVFPVGPRESWENPRNQEWLFALQVAPGFSEEPPEDETVRRKWAEAMLPWRALLRAPSTAIRIEWRFFRQKDPRVGMEAVAECAAPPEPLDLQPTLVTAFPDFAVRREPPRVFAGPRAGTIGEVHDKQILLPAVLPAFGGATPEITSGALQYTWYFRIPAVGEILTEVKEAMGRGLTVAAWPLEFFDTRDTHAIRFEFERSARSYDFSAGSALRIRYQAPQLHHSDYFASILPFPMERLISPTEPALKTYWLPATDSRLDSVAEIHTVVSNGLQHRARAAFLTPELLVNADVSRQNSVDAAADARLFADVARRLFDVNEDHTREQRDKRASELIAAAIQDARRPGATLLESIRLKLVETAATWWVSEGLAAINARARLEGIIAPGGAEWTRGHDDLFAQFGLYVVPSHADVRPVLPGEGIDILLGDAALRLRHEGVSDDPQNDAGNASDHAHIAELGVLVRRAGSRDDLPNRRWHLATAALVALDTKNELAAVDRYWGSEIDPPDVPDESIDYRPEPVVRGIKSSFIKGLSSTDVAYYGAPLVTETIGSALHGIPGERAERGQSAFVDLVPLSFQPVGPVADHVDRSRWCLTPPLRYGDFYQFAGFVIDRGGGIPEELVPPGAPALSLALDWFQLEPGNLPVLDAAAPIEFLRRVPVGEINIVPVSVPAPGKRPEWPALPAGVVLRSREWLSASTTDNLALPALLLSKGDGFDRQRDGFVFRVSAPALDEHTLSRWLMPSAVDPSDADQVEEAERQRDVITEALASIHRRRDALIGKRAALKDIEKWEPESDALPPDPAVSKIGLRCHFVDGGGNAQTRQSFLDVSVDVTVAVSDVASLVDPIGLPAGTFAVLEFVPLVKAVDFKRFEEAAMAELTESDPWTDADGEPYIAFQASRVLVEAATTDLPEDRSLFEAFRLRELAGGAIEVSLKSADGLPLKNMQFVDSFELARERWTWRNRPIVFEGGALQSDLPHELWLDDPTRRDESVAVLRFDALAQLDRGLVDRGRVGGRVPRRSDGAPVAAPQLLVDDRDAVTHADYLRYGCVLVSRYAGILEPDRRSVQACGASHTDPERRSLEKERLWRRVTAVFRGDDAAIKAPKTLAILPLTRGLGHEGITGVSGDATPVLIVLDEIWFREYGVGEQLNVEIVLETKEIGDGDTEARPFRVGPLPDHYVATHFDGPPYNGKRHFYEGSTDGEQDKAGGIRHTFKVFGPFGHSLDRSGNEALANATAFIAYAPHEVQAHYVAFIRLRRVVRGRKIIEGPAGGTYAVYTQPDVAHLALANGTVHLTQNTCTHNAALTLRPTAETPDETVAKQYRYLLIFGPEFDDFARGSDLFLPAGAAWIRPDGPNVTWPGGTKGKSGPYRGRVLELLLNGRYDYGLSPLEEKSSLKDILSAMFVDDRAPEDAAAMIRRISPSFDVTVE